jgi:hypothetical protein
MSDPNTTIGPKQARLSGTHKAVALTGIIEAKARQAENAAINPLKAFAHALAHAFVGAALIGFSAFGAAKDVPWFVWFPLGVAGLFAAFPATVSAALKLTLAAVKDAIATKKEAGP